MWGFGGRFYWGRKLLVSQKLDGNGIVVVFAWMSSEEKYLKKYVDLYSSIGWDSLVCHSQFLNMFFPERAISLAVDILNELVEVLKIRPCPIVFASFSGGAKACMLEVLKIIGGKYEAHNKDDYQLVRDCISGHIFDSSPVDFTSDLGVRFVLHPTALKISHPPRVASWVANVIASSLDALFLSRFELQRAEYWQILYSTIKMQAPYLIFCSENDDLASFQVICGFVQRLKELGADVKVVKWSASPHVGHYRHHPIEYKASVTDILGKAVAIYSHRISVNETDRVYIEGTKDGISYPMPELRTASKTSTSFESFSLARTNWSPCSMEYCEEDKDVGLMLNEGKEDLVHQPSTPSIIARGVLGQMLSDVCVPENVEGWDLRLNSNNVRSLSGIRRQATFNPVRCTRRSRM